MTPEAIEKELTIGKAVAEATTILRDTLGLTEVQVDALLAALWLMEHGQTPVKRSETVWEWAECPNH